MYIKRESEHEIHIFRKSINSEWMNIDKLINVSMMPDNMYWWTLDVISYIYKTTQNQYLYKNNKKHGWWLIISNLLVNINNLKPMDTISFV